MALVPYLDEDDLADEDRDLLARPINLVRALAHSPGGLRALAGLDGWIRHGSRLDPRLRELAIVQVGYLTASAYEFSHHVSIGRDAGVDDADITTLIAATKGTARPADELDALVLTAAREITVQKRMDDATWRGLSRHLPVSVLVELVIVIAYYNAVVRLLATLQIDVEPAYGEILQTFPLPDDPVG